MGKGRGEGKRSAIVWRTTNRGAARLKTERETHHGGHWGITRQGTIRHKKRATEKKTGPLAQDNGQTGISK